MDFLHKLHDPEGLKQLIEWGSYFLLFAIIFAETGLLIGFFLPGDSLLFVAGTLCAIPLRQGQPPILNVAELIPLLCVAAIAGDTVGYLIGNNYGLPAVWLMFAVVAAIGLVIAGLFAIETKNRVLEDISP